MTASALNIRTSDSYLNHCIILRFTMSLGGCQMYDSQIGRVKGRNHVYVVEREVLGNRPAGGAQCKALQRTNQKHDET